jgi:hypothetical protein
MTQEERLMLTGMALIAADAAKDFLKSAYR